MIVEGNNVAEVWLELLHFLRRAPQVSPRGKPTRELLGVQLRLHDLRNNVLVCQRRDLNYRFMVAEWLWIALGRNDVESISRYNKQIVRFSDDGATFAGAYGPRLMGQWQWLVKKLEQDSCTRQGVVSVWTPSPSSSKDVPCTLNLQFLCRDDRLNCVVTMRSSDVWLGLPYDVFNFSMLVSGVAGELGLETGWLTLNLGSSHLYDDNNPETDILQASHLRSPELPMMPPHYMNNSLEALHENRGDLYPTEPWHSYNKVLWCKTRHEALEVLRDLATHA